MTATNGTWTGSPTSYAIQWRRCNTSGATCTDISGASASTYLVQAADVNNTLRVRVTASNSAGPSSPADSTATATVTAAPSGGGSSFGASAPGGSFAAPGAGYKFGTPYVLTSSASATQFQFYARGGSASQSFTPAIYASNGSSPTTLVATGATVTVAANQAAGWVTSTLPATSLNAGTYYLVLVSGTTSNATSIYYDPGNPSDGVYNTNTPGAPTATFGTANTEPRRYSYRVTTG